MSTSATPPPTRWVGWARAGRRGRWRRLVHDCASAAEAMAQLRQATAREKFIDLCVRPAHRGSPDEDRPRS
jgi:hypothetical protein